MNTQEHTAQTLEGLLQLTRFLRTSQWGDGTDHGLTPTQGVALSILTRKGPMRLSELAMDLGITQPTASDVVSAACRKGFMERTPDPHDARAKQIQPTARGKLIAESFRRSPPVEDALGSLPEQDLAAFKRTLTQIIVALQEAGEITPQRHCLTCSFFRPHHHHDDATPHHCEFVNQPFGNISLRLDCEDHKPASPEQAVPARSAFKHRRGL